MNGNEPLCLPAKGNYVMLQLFVKLFLLDLSRNKLFDYGNARLEVQDSSQDNLHTIFK